MLSPFFILAGQSPTRQGTFRRAVAAHLAVLAGAIVALMHDGPPRNLPLLGHLLLVAGIVEGATLIGWRLTQLPKSQALEFMLVSPIRPARLLLAEALVGLTMLVLVNLAGLPVLLILAASGVILPLDCIPLVLMPITWGAITGLGLTVWAYEPKKLRRWAERLLIGGVLLYLVVGILAGENLRHWVKTLPEDWQTFILRAVADFHAYNPFGVLKFWLTQAPIASYEMMLALELAALIVFALLLWRAAMRLQGHFHERHYEPVRDVRHEVRPAVGNQPLAWWAVKRVTEYSGKINLWVAGGFCLLYAFYQIAGDHWPAWMGRRIFQMCDEVGGSAALAVALILLAAVPAAFQYGLWDSSNQDRCRRLELLLLTELSPLDYWRAACAAAWRRGRGYFVVALMLWLAAVIGGRITLVQALAGLAAGVLLWSLYFALGFRAFARGAQANGLGMLLTVGLPLGAVALGQLGWPLVAAWLPPGMVYRAAASPGDWPWLVGPMLAAGVCLATARRSLRTCDAQLRAWYDRHHGSKVQG